MIRIYCILIVILLMAVALGAQEQLHPHRTAADIASKQTEMLIRELNITDSVLRDTLYRMHLKYAELRTISNTRNEAMQRMIQMQEELKNILSPEQFEAFMNRQLNHNPRSPQRPCNWIAPHPVDTQFPSHAVPDMPPPPPTHLP